MDSPRKLFASYNPPSMTDLLNQASTLWTTTDARSLATYAVLAVGAYVVYSTLKANRFAKSLPPSPPGLPLIGHTHLLSGVKYSWRTFYDYSREFNAPVMSFKWVFLPPPWVGS